MIKHLVPLAVSLLVSSCASAGVFRSTVSQQNTDQTEGGGCAPCNSLPTPATARIHEGLRLEPDPPDQYETWRLINDTPSPIRSAQWLGYYGSIQTRNEHNLWTNEQRRGALCATVAPTDNEIAVDGATTVTEPPSLTQRSPLAVGHYRFALDVRHNGRIERVSTEFDVVGLDELQRDMLLSHLRRASRNGCTHLAHLLSLAFEQSTDIETVTLLVSIPTSDIQTTLAVLAPLTRDNRYFSLLGNIMNDVHYERSVAAAVAVCTFLGCQGQTPLGNAAIRRLTSVLRSERPAPVEVFSAITSATPWSQEIPRLLLRHLTSSASDITTEQRLAAAQALLTASAAELGPLVMPVVHALQRMAQRTTDRSASREFSTMASRLLEEHRTRTIHSSPRSYHHQLAAGLSSTAPSETCIEMELEVASLLRSARTTVQWGPTSVESLDPGTSTEE